ncbi:gamma-glutamyltransferase [Azospirillum sp. RWY-5-1]|uniref:Glutathione hydrolase proenzyme n=1 Tax=Azospirillum oleiclasticum TaxID=2735135 RepID=A0ABX2T4E0_9PROT|nr:gamma-glutamyltransferase [Azospirillum oleiclasticum]NYZ11876.1 gamma-glutamyltransferase [Azospirillum oleiclasticum]NYZ19036.1 gamma-glutamyltransferase [Azospirillum oleiclasticum]
MTELANRWRRLAGAGLLALLAAAPAWAQTDIVPPEAATGRGTRDVERATRFMVAAANPLAAEAGREVLRNGGSAVDAAIAVQLVLTLVEPQSSGLGGGAFLVHYDAATKTTTTYDGRETAPAAAKPERFLAANGKPMPFYDAVVGGRSVGVPGTVRLLEFAHRKHGSLPWPRLFEKAIRLADTGFTVSPRLAGLIALDKHLKSDPAARAYFYDAEGRPLAPGVRLKNPELAATLKTLAERGADAFYSGLIAADIVKAVAGHPTNPGDMTEDDLKGYAVKERLPVCGGYRVWTICGMGPPSSGAIAVQQMLGVLETVDLASMGPGSLDAVHWFAEAGRLAFADRALYLADPDFVKVPVKGLLDPRYVRSRARLVDPKRSMQKAEPGNPPYQDTRVYGASEGIENGTSHIAVVDAKGNAVSMTTTIEDGFGARLMVRGFLLNNELTDFGFAPVADGKPVANRVEPGKRPRSSMAPTLVFREDGGLHAVVGSPGGSAIINYVTKTLVAILDWGLDPQVAIDLPNFGSRNGPTELEERTEAEGWKAGLEARNHPVRVLELTSGIQAIVATGNGYIGGADTRREGVAIGD